MSRDVDVGVVGISPCCACCRIAAWEEGLIGWAGACWTGCAVLLTAAVRLPRSAVMVMKVGCCDGGRDDILQGKKGWLDELIQQSQDEYMMKSKNCAGSARSARQDHLCKWGYALIRTQKLFTQA